MHRTAQEVLDLLKQNQYATLQEKAEKGTKLYTPDFAFLEQGELFPHDRHLGTTVTEETTQEAAHRLVVKEGKKNVVLLNFASAKHAGGGFTTGSKAQEEDLCRCSGLYPCLAQSSVNEYYRHNRSQKTPLYSDFTIYSPNVPWFRKDSTEKPGEPFLASVITSPAPNAGRLDRKYSYDLEVTLRLRAAIILAIAQDNKHRNLVLGAWGCGVFRNSPVMVADAFKEWLLDERFVRSFDHITFAIYCPGKDKSTLKAFQESFK